MTLLKLCSIIAILICTAIGWCVLGQNLQMRTAQSSELLGQAVAGVWGPPMKQQHPVFYYPAPNSVTGQHLLQPSASDVKVTLKYQPKKKGLLWYRTYLVDFKGEYKIVNPTPIKQIIYVKFQFPSKDASYNHFSFNIDGKPTTEESKNDEGMTAAVTLEPQQSSALSVAYETRGTDAWGYAFGESTRIRNFNLDMTTDFDEINFPAGTSSASDRQRFENGWRFSWKYPDVIGALPIGMDMPKVLNPGPVASRIAFFAPVSLVFFFAVLLIMGAVWNVDLHPMNYFFLSAGAFAFQLLFAYSVDLIPLLAAFIIAATVSLALVSGYLFLVVGRGFARLAALAQFAYMVLFSYSFFFDGLTGLAITLGAIITLAVLMVTTAKVDWSAKFAAPLKRATPPPIPAAA